MFKEIIEELRGHGLTFKQIADFCQCSNGSIEGIYRGAAQEPRWSTGDRLIKLRNRMAKLKAELS